VRADWFERGRWESRIEGGESFLEVREASCRSCAGCCKAARSVWCWWARRAVRAHAAPGAGQRHAGVRDGGAAPTRATCWRRRRRRGCAVCSGAGRSRATEVAFGGRWPSVGLRRRLFA
jgi:hypothetical protein